GLVLIARGHDGGADASGVRGEGTGGVTLNDFFATPGVSPLFRSKEEAEAVRCPRWDLFRSGLGFGRFEGGLRGSSLSCRPRKRLPHLLRTLVRPPALSRGGAWRIGTYGGGGVSTGPLRRAASKLVMELSVQLPPSFAASARLMLPIFAVPVARCTGAGDCLHLSEQADRQRRNL